MSIKKYKYVFIIIVVVILVFLNIKKYREMNDVVVPVWSSYDEEYYNSQNNNVIDKIRNTFNPGRMIYGITRVRLRAPITYLKREIPLLAYYTPEELKEPTETIYRPESDQNSIIRLKFNIEDKVEDSQIVEDNSKIVEENNGSAKREENNYQEDNSPGNRKVSSREPPIIAIYHTHTSETYMDDPRKQDNNGHVLPGNIGSIGKVGIELAKVLSEKYGFRVIHTTKIHDQSYNRSYYNSRNTVKNLLQSNPDVDLILDIHRDGIRANVSREAITSVIEGQRTANVMIVVGNGKYDYGEQDKNNRSSWKENLKLANSMSTLMDQIYPGLLRRVEIRDTTSNRYNQDLHPRSLLLEIGDYRNTTQEAVIAVRYVADVIEAMF